MVAPPELKPLLKEKYGTNIDAALKSGSKNAYSANLHAIEDDIVATYVIMMIVGCVLVCVCVCACVARIRDVSVVCGVVCVCADRCIIDRRPSPSPQPPPPHVHIHSYGSASDGAFQDRDLKVEFKKLVKQRMALMVANEGRRADGRGPTEVRPISIELGVLPVPHGSVLFTRGETQVCGWVGWLAIVLGGFW